MEPISLNDIALFMENLLNVYGGYLSFTFSVMMAFSLLFGVRKLILGER